MGRILIADDEESILSVMMDILQDAGHEVKGVGDGAAALAELEQNQYDVALIDVMMPKMGGYHVAVKIHAMPNPPKIVIVTARSFDADHHLLTNVGVDAYLPKPFAKQDLLNVVTKLLSQK